MTLSAVATRYAHALADVVTASGSPVRPEDAIAQLKAFEAVLRSSLELRTALATPAVPTARKRAVVGRIAGVLQLQQILRNFLFVLVDHRLAHPDHPQLRNRAG
jgi:F-type H+-transporting ATPase subunit delta